MIFWKLGPRIIYPPVECTGLFKISPDFVSEKPRYWIYIQSSKIKGYILQQQAYSRYMLHSQSPIQVLTMPNVQLLHWRDQRITTRKPCFS